MEWFQVRGVLQQDPEQIYHEYCELQRRKALGQLNFSNLKNISSMADSSFMKKRKMKGEKSLASTV